MKKLSFTDYAKYCIFITGMVALGYFSLVSKTKLIGESTDGRAIYEQCKGFDCSGYFYFVRDDIDKEYCLISRGNRVVGNRCYQGNPNSHVIR